MIDYNKLLTGKQVRLWPYIKGKFPQDTMVAAWRLINESGAAYRAFWPYAKDKKQKTVDLPFFIEYMDRCIPVLVQDIETKTIIGLIWFDNIKVNHRVNINLFFIRKARGTKVREAGMLATRYAFQAFNIKSIWGYTPWLDAVRLAEKTGFKRIAQLPGYALIRGSLQDVYIVMKDSHDNVSV